MIFIIHSKCISWPLALLIVTTIHYSVSQKYEGLESKNVFKMEKPHILTMLDLISTKTNIVSKAETFHKQGNHMSMKLLW